MTITKEQLIAGALISGYNTISNLDYAIILSQLKKEGKDITFDNKIDNILKYLDIEKNNISLKADITLDSKTNKSTTIKDYLSELAGKDIIQFYNKYSIETHVLEKTKILTPLDEDNIVFYYTQEEKEILEDYLKKKFVSTIWIDDIPYLSYQLISITDKGILELFKRINYEEYEQFINQINSLRYNPELVDEYLLNQDLSQIAWHILSINNFYDYCRKNNKCITIPGASKVEFTLCDKEELIPLLEKEELTEIYITSPNNIFTGPNLITENISRIENVTWSQIDFNKMLKSEYHTIADDINNEIKSLLSELSYTYTEQVSDHNKPDAVSYKAIVKRYKVGEEYQNQIIALLQYDFMGLGIAINPEITKQYKLKLK